VPVVGKPLIDYAIDFLAASGVEKIVVNSHYFAEMLEGYLQKRSNVPQIIISRETEVLETGGGIKNALPILGESPFFVVNSDVICLDREHKIPALVRLAQNFDAAKMDAILLLHKVENAVGYYEKGDFFLNETGGLRRRKEHEIAPYVFTGIQIINPRLFTAAPDGKFSLNVLYNRDLSRISAIIHEGEWLHVGSVAELAQAENYLKNL
jgi:MurNAc alpha-1-phosphate uridylyltransferase